MRCPSCGGAGEFTSGSRCVRCGGSGTEGSLLGRRVRIIGGIEDGLTGVVVANEPDRSRNNPYGADRPFRYRVLLDFVADGALPQTIGGLHPVNLQPTACSYCGTGGCAGTALTANGADLERFDEAHEPGRTIIREWLAAGAPR